MRVSRFKALAASTGLSVLFLVVYSGCNWITGQRGHVGSLYFQWERGIPFVPFMILPYMSIDLFFVAAPFLCRTDEELRIFSRRVTAAILIAGLCFLLFPLRFAFPRPHASGLLGEIFDWFRGMDLPFNLLPSLHASLLLLLVDVYWRNLRGVFLFATMLWFFLIGLSPLLTYQHHLIDILGGFVLAGYCFYLFCEPSLALPVIVNRRVGSYYAAGAVVSLLLGAVFWPWGVLLLWPTIALSIVAIAYFGVGPIIFHKTKGKLPWSTRFVLAFCLLGQYLSLLYYRSQCRSWDEVTPRIWIGGKLGARSANKALCGRVTAVLDLSAEFSEAKPFRNVVYRNIPVLDLTAPTQAQLVEMSEFIGSHSRNGVVYVHCKIGYSRSAAAVAAYLIMNRNAKSAEEAFMIIRRVRPSIVIRSEVVSALSEFASRARSLRGDADSFLLALDHGAPP
ncbi:MAG TPA: dual specificity protein phosphatase family protein [Candidatus Udaeobacter sp.]|nr:dual specificity protein phosphatase family protein [Candidatus Udaeobacter sp.]